MLQLAREAPCAACAVEVCAERPDREHVDDVPSARHARGRPVRMVREAVRVDALEVPARAAAAGAPQPLFRHSHLRRNSFGPIETGARPTGASSPTKIRHAAGAVAADHRQRRVHQLPVHARRRGRRLQEVAVVGLVPDRELVHGRQPAEAARVALCHRGRKLPYSPALTFQLAVAKLRPRPPGGRPARGIAA